MQAFVFFAEFRVKSTQSVSYNRNRSHPFGECVPLLPLFPLDVVLFPGTPLPLHIFEPRYKEMIGECRANGSLFGVVRAVKQGIAEIGCTAEIVSVTKEYPDGRLDLVAEGRQRFEVMELNQERSFLRAEVLVVPDEPGTASQETRDRAIELHQEILNLAGAVQDLSAADQENLSFYLAGSLPLDLDFKQKLLGTRSEAERIGALANYLQSIVPNLRSAARARAKAGGNGHVR
jgi:Lon protease-like protein